MNPALIAIGGAAAVSAAIALTPTVEKPDTSLGLEPPAAQASQTSRVASPPAVNEPVPHAAALVHFLPDGVTSNAVAGAAPAVNTAPVLVGLAFGGARPIAYVMAGGKPWRAGVGDPVGAWKLASIGKHEATLRRDRKVLRLSLFAPRPGPPPPIPSLSPFATPQAAAAPAEQTASVTPAPAASPAPANAAPFHPAPPPPAGAPRYWVGPPGSAPPGFIPMPPSALPPPPIRQR